MKKIIIGIVALVMALSSTGCSEKKDTDSSLPSGSSNTAASDEKLVESHKNYEMGIGYFNKQDYENAKYKLEQVIKDDPDYEDAQKKLEEMIEIKRQKYLSDAESEAKSSNYTKANEILNKALEEYPDDKQIKDRIDEYEKSYHDSLVSAASKSYDDKDYIGAIKNYNTVLLHYPDDTDAASRIEELKTIIKSDADKQLKNKEYTAAVEKMKTLVNLFPKDDDISKKYKTIYESSVQGILNQADAIHKKDGYFKAIQYLKGISGISDSRINDKITYLYGFEPVYLKDLEAYEVSGEYDYLENKDLSDNYENEYITSMYPHGKYMFSEGQLDSGDDVFVSYYVKGEYKKLSGVIGVSNSFRTKEYKTRIEIYADDIKIFTSNTFTKGSKPQVFSLDISNADFIKIKWVSGENRSFAQEATLFNANFTKQ